MFLAKYLNESYFNQILDTYDEDYLKSLDEHNFIIIYQLFGNYNFYYIDDIVLKYLEIFEMDPNEVRQKLDKLKEKLGEKFVFLIGNNMTYLEEIIN